MKKVIIALTAAFFTHQGLHAQQDEGGIMGKEAPEINVNKWMHIPEGLKAPTKEELKGKVVYMYCYQSWCPGCHSSGFPTLRKVSNEFKDSDDVAFVVVQTVFEGFSTNTPDKWKGIADKYELTHLPFGHSGSQDKRSSVMRDFRTRGTPWTVIIGKDGKVKYNGFHIKADSAITVINQLKKVKSDTTSDETTKE